MTNAVQTINQEQPRSVAPVTPMEMLQIAVNKGADLDQLQKLMDLQERWEANEARKAFVTALNAFKSDPPEIFKNKEIKHDKKLIAKYAGLDQVSNEIGTALSAHGLSHRWDTAQLDGGMIRVTCILTHEMGHSEKTTLQAAPDATGAKNGVQAIGSTVTYLQRYTLLAATGMATSDMDDDGKAAGGDGPITEEQLDLLRARLDSIGADIPKFCQYMGVGGLALIPQSKLKQAHDALTKKGAPK